jgi:hypothetical protein
MLNNFLDKKFSDLDMEQLVYYLDRNNDGLISYEDFRDLLRPIGSEKEFNEFDEIKEKNKKEFRLNNIIYQNNKYYINGNNDNNNVINNKNINNNSFPISPIPKTNYLSGSNSNNNSSDNMNTEDNNENDKINKGQNYKNRINRTTDEKVDKEKEYLYEKYLYTDNYDIIINDEQDENYDYSNINTMNNFIPKILKEEKDGIPNIKEATFTFGNKILENNNTQSKNEDNVQDNNVYKENDDVIVKCTFGNFSFLNK